MKIHNTASYFLDNYQPTEEFLKEYYDKYSSHFKEYFLYHCKKVEEKKKAAHKKYEDIWSEMEDSSNKIEGIIQEIVSEYEKSYRVKFTKDVHIIIGLFGSNAFTHRQLIPEITFCIEQLSSRDEHLKVIVAHEFGHALHNILSDREEMDWLKLEWSSPYTWLLQEGCATHFSKKAAKADSHIYFSYGTLGDEKWISYAETNLKEIITAFKKDISESSPSALFHEWFSINGGRRFGYTRLGYFVGYQAVKRLIAKYGEIRAVTLWKEPDFHSEIILALSVLEEEHMGAPN